MITIVGMTGAGKTVLISTMLHRIERMQRDNPRVSLKPCGDYQRQTLLYALQNWNILNSGKWPPSTPAGELVEMEWELKTKKTMGSIHLLDCAGQDLRTLFSQDVIDPDTVPDELNLLYNRITESNVLAVLINTGDLIQADNAEELADLYQLLHTLIYKKKKKHQKIAIVLSQFDRYNDELKKGFNGDLNEFLYERLPYIYNEFIHNKLIDIIPVAAVANTVEVLDNGSVQKFPVPDFESYNLDKFTDWIADNVDDIASRTIFTPLFKCISWFFKKIINLFSFINQRFLSKLTLGWKIFFSIYTILSFVALIISIKKSFDHKMSLILVLSAILAIAIGNLTIKKIIKQNNIQTEISSMSRRQICIYTLITILYYLGITGVLFIFWYCIDFLLRAILH